MVVPCYYELRRLRHLHHLDAQWNNGVGIVVVRLIGKVTVTTDQITNVAGSRLRVEPEPEFLSLCESHFEPKRLAM